MKKVLILDTETTGLDPKEAFVISISARIYDMESGKEGEGYYAKVKHEGWDDLDDDKWNNDINKKSDDPKKKGPQDINKITLDDILTQGVPKKDVKSKIQDLAHECDVILAHNAKFDRGMCAAYQNFGTSFGRRWICSVREIEWPEGWDVPRHTQSRKPSRSLGNLAKSQGIDIEGAHNAHADTEILLSVLQRLSDFHEQVRACRHIKSRWSVRGFDSTRISEYHDAGFSQQNDSFVFSKKMSVIEAENSDFSFDIICTSTGELKAVGEDVVYTDDTRLLKSVYTDQEQELDKIPFTLDDTTILSFRSKDKRLLVKKNNLPPETGEREYENVSSNEYKSIRQRESGSLECLNRKNFIFSNEISAFDRSVRFRDFCEDGQVAVGIGSGENDSKIIYLVDRDSRITESQGWSAEEANAVIRDPDVALIKRKSEEA